MRTVPSANDHRSRMVNRRLISGLGRRRSGEALTISVYPETDTGSKGWSAGMADERRPRPVSGEIMTDPPEAAASDALAARSSAATSSTPNTRPSGRAAPQSRSHRSAPAPTAIASAAAPLAGMDMLRRREAPAAPAAASARRPALLDRRHRACRRRLLGVRRPCAGARRAVPRHAGAAAGAQHFRRHLARRRVRRAAGAVRRRRGGQ